MFPPFGSRHVSAIRLAPCTANLTVDVPNFSLPAPKAFERRVIQLGKPCESRDVRRASAQMPADTSDLDLKVDPCTSAS
jgi:hypothetical protein